MHRMGVGFNYLFVSLSFSLCCLRISFSFRCSFVADRIYPSGLHFMFCCGGESVCTRALDSHNTSMNNVIVCHNYRVEPANHCVYVCALAHYVISGFKIIAFYYMILIMLTTNFQLLFSWDDGSISFNTWRYTALFPFIVLKTLCNA